MTAESTEVVETVRLSEAEYRAALSRVFPQHALDEVASTVDSIGLISDNYFSRRLRRFGGAAGAPATIRIPYDWESWAE